MGLKQKIIFTVTNDLVTDQRMMRICQSLSHAGFEVTLVGRIKHNSLPLPALSFEAKRLKCVFNSGPLFYAEYNLKLFAFLLRQKVQIISSVDADTLLACSLAKILTQAKLAFDAHEFFEEVPELKNKFIIKKIWHYLQQILLPYTQLRYTVGHTIAKQLEATFNASFKVIYNMPVANAISHNNPQKIILYQGDLNEGRGLELLITSMQHINAECWIVGDGLLYEPLNKLITQLNLGEKVKLLGKKTPDELKEITPQCYAGINILTPDSLSYQLSIANKFFDYVQAGIPVVCAPFENYIYFNRQHEVAVWSEYTEQALTEAIQKLLEDESLYQKLSANCKEAAKNWIWEKQASELIHAYRILATNE